jgi:hypothetical protein
MEFGEAMGRLHHRRRELAGDKNAHGSKGGVDDHILGCLGELAYAKATCQYPSGLFLEMADDDDVSGTQVRTRRKHAYDLYLWKKDDPTCTFALVTGVGPEFIYHGEIAGSEAMTPLYWVEAGSMGAFPRVSCYVIQKVNLTERLPFVG